MTRTSQKKTVLAAAVLTGLLGVSACSGDSENNDSATNDSTTNDSAGNADADQDTETSDDAAATSGGGGDADTDAAPELDDVPDVVAEVDGQEITKDDFVSTYEAQLEQASMQSEMGGEPVDEDELKQQVLDGLIDNELLAQAVAEHELEASEEEIDESLEELAAGNGMETADFLAALEEQGMAQDEVRTEVGNQVSTDKLIEQEAPVEDPSEEELQERYDEIAEQQEAAEGSGDDAAASGAPEMELPPFEEVRDQLEEQVRSEEQAVAVQDYLEGLRDDAEITTNL